MVTRPPVRLATWNIRAGGGRRSEAIAQVLIEENPDLLVLTEFRERGSARLLKLLEPMSAHRMAGMGKAVENAVCLISRFPLSRFETRACPASRHRWLAAEIEVLDLVVLAVHIPNQTERWNKQEFWDCVHMFDEQSRGRRRVILGDLNTALDEDCQGAKIRAAVHLKRLLEGGWVDAWRRHNPDAAEYTWFSHRRNGFRLDYCLASPEVAPSLGAAELRHDVREEGLSDHSLLRVDLSV